MLYLFSEPVLETTNLEKSIYGLSSRFCQFHAEGVAANTIVL